MDSMRPASFAFRLVGTGWAEATFAVGDRWAALTASYLSDALGDLLAAIEALLDGAPNAAISWAEEPGEFDFRFVQDGDGVEVRVLWFDDWDIDRAAEDLGEERLRVRVELNAMAAAVALGAREALDLYGLDGYAERWVDFPFPLARLEAIERRLS